MANPQSFSLFPSKVPKIALPNPHKRHPSLHQVRTLVADDENNNNLNGESKVEGRPPVPPLTLSFQADDKKQSSPLPGEIGRAVTTSTSPGSKSSAQPSPPLNKNYVPGAYGGPDSKVSSSSPEPGQSLGGESSMTTLVAGPGTGKSTQPKSPVVPIRSMFPTYNPAAPMFQQKYVPQRPIAAHLSRWETTNPDPRNSLSIQFMAPNLPSAPPSLFNFQGDTASINGGPRFTSQRDLEKLWDATHGAEPDGSLKPFNLEMSRTDEATFVFGSNPATPFYTLQTFDTAEIAIAKHHPRTAAPSDIFLCSVAPPSSPQNNNLVSFIFPKLAAMLAIRQSAQLAQHHSLAPTDRDEVEAQAVQRAARQEACSLRYNSRGFYELEHPAINRGSMREDFTLKSPVPTSPTLTVRSITGKPVLHITIDKTDRPLPLVSIINPNASRIQSPPVSAGGSGIPLSTFHQSSPQMDTTTLVSLDLTSQSLHIDANAILLLMPSLFAIDSLMAALLAVCVCDHTLNPVLGGMEIGKPASRNAAGPSRSATRNTRPGSVRSYAGSGFYATIAEREEAEEEARQMRRDSEREAKRSRKGKKVQGEEVEEAGRTWFGKKKLTEEQLAAQKAEKRKKKVVVRVFDLEKLGHYQGGERKGEELPVVVRGVVGTLVGLLRLIVWMLTAIVRLVVWVLVKGTRCVTSEKF